jgi:flagella basal body P-ring formation protein FlgA
MMPLAALALTGCLAVGAGSDRVLAGDLAAAIPGLTAPALDVPVAFAPAPGVERVFRLAELRRLAQRFGWDVTPDADICVVRPVSPPDPARLLAAMRMVLPEADIAIVEYGRQPLPAGEIEFPLSGLGRGTGDALWIGYVHYAGTRRFALWARVKVLVAVTRVIAAEDLPPGQAIPAEQVRIETGRQSPQAVPFLESGGQAIGKWPRVRIRAGTALRAGMLENPKEVVRGDSVTVEVRNGAAHLELEARAEASGAVGETIAVLNPESHKRFLARVEGKGRVSVGSSAVKVNP